MARRTQSRWRFASGASLFARARAMLPARRAFRGETRCGAVSGRLPLLMRDTQILEKPSSDRREEFLAAVRRSRTLHKPWVSAPDTRVLFDAYLERLGNATHLSYWVITADGQLAGVVNISEIVRGVFHSGYLGYYAFEPFNGQGY